MRIFRSTPPLTGKLPGYFPVALILLIHFITLASADGTVSIASFTSFGVQRLCVKDCLWGGQPGGGVALPGYLSCPAPYSDSCMCRTDLAVTVSTFLSSCVGNFCSSNTVDIGSAINLYNNYCNSKLAIVTSAALLSIESFTAYSTARVCVQDCLYAGLPGGGAALPNALQCADFFDPPYNDCVCRADLWGTVSSFLTSCANKYCTGDTADINSAVSIYTAYCDAALATTTAAASAAASSQTASPSQTTTIATKSISPGSGSTSTSTASTQSSPGTGGINNISSGGKPLSGGAAAGVAVGSVLVVGLLCFGGLCFWRRNRKEPTAGEKGPNRDGEDVMSNTTNTTWLRPGINEWLRKMPGSGHTQYTPSET